MARINSNEKGARFERRMCVALSMWISHKTRDDLFWRTPMSGGRATLASRKGRRQGMKPRKSQCGDLTALDDIALPLTSRFFVECKDHGDLMLRSVFYDVGGKLDEIWDKPLRQASEAGKTPLCIVKELRKPEIVLCTKTTYDAFNDAAGGRLPLKVAFARDGLVVHAWHFHHLLTRCDPGKLFGHRKVERETL